MGGWLADQQTMREEAKAKAHNRWFYGGIAVLPVLAFIWFAPAFFGNFKIFAAIAAIGGIGYYGYLPIAEAKKTIKIGINSAIARDLGIQYEHDVMPGHEYEACRTYGLVPGCDRDSFEDRWFGDFEGHAFNLYEAHLEERRQSGKNSRWVTVFRGAILHMEFGREFTSTTLLQRKGKHKKWFGLGGRKDEVSFDGHKLKFVDQVHPAFEDVFDVYSDDQIEARVLIHPSYVENLVALESAFHGDAVRALFSRGEVVIAIESGNLFESGSMDAADDEARVAEAAEQFGAMAKLALTINQNERGRVLAKEPKRTLDHEPAQPAPISAADRRQVRRSSGGFGRKGA